MNTISHNPTDSLRPSSKRQPNRALVAILAASALVTGCSADAKDKPNFSPSIIVDDRAGTSDVDLQSMTVGDCKRNPNSWATDSGGLWNADGSPVESSTVIGLAEEYTADGLPILGDGAQITRRMGSLTIETLYGDLFRDPTVIDEAIVFETAVGNTITISPYDDYRASIPGGSNNRKDEPLVVTISCGQ